MIYIELFLDHLWVVSSFRHSWSRGCKNPPNPNFTFQIYKKDLKKLIKLLGHVVVLGTSNDYQFVSGNLYLKTIDSQNPETLKWKDYRKFINNNY